MAQTAVNLGFIRFDGRHATQMRPVTMEAGVNRYAEGSCLITVGHTKVLCTASFENKVPKFLHRTGKGWLTAEYGLLPRATHTRTDREATQGRQSGRTHEIQRLIGRTLRTVVNTDLLGERTLVIDCDVLQADGGTRTAAITGAYVAMRQAVDALLASGKLTQNPITGQVAAISCGVLEGGVPVTDLCYEEDSTAIADANYVLTRHGEVVEQQITAERQPVNIETLNTMYQYARDAITALCLLQNETLQKICECVIIEQRNA